MENKVLLRLSLLWDVRHRRLVVSYLRFLTVYRSLRHGASIYTWNQSPITMTTKIHNWTPSCKSWIEINTS